jgi:sugar lactone lactonase YvrE
MKIKGRITLSNPYEALYPGGGHTAVREEGSNWVWQYINMPDGKPAHVQEFYYLYSDAGQILFDAKGYLYVATAVGIQICDQNGRVRAILSLPSGSVESIAFAGNNLFAIAGGKLYVRRLLRSGTHQGTPKSEGQG